MKMQYHRAFYFLLFRFCLGISCQEQNEQDFQLQEGDILFQDGDCGDFCEAIRKVSQGYHGNNFSHNGLLIKENGKWFVLEAIFKGVSLTALDTFLLRHLDQNGNPNVHVGRLIPEYRQLIPDAIKHARTLIGKPYDYEFNLFNGAYYCSELIHLSFSKANLGHPIFEVRPMTFKDPETGTTFPVWETYFEDLEIKIPEGEPGLNPGGMSLDPSIVMVYSYQELE